MKVVSWNVNGLRTLENIQDIFTSFKGDIVCFQETKLSRSQLDSNTAKLEDYYSFFSFSQLKLGYAGVATYVKKQLCPFEVDCSYEELDIGQEGRSLITYHKRDGGRSLAIVNVYVPFGGCDDPERSNNKMIFLQALKDKLQSFIGQDTDFMVVGDLNVKYLLIDSAEAYENKNDSVYVKEWMYSPDKFIFSNMVYSEMLIDSYRTLYPKKLEAYSCWNTKLNARVNNYGTRIDYVLLSKSLKTTLKTAEILAGVMGSDHCPVSAELDISDISPPLTVPRECTIFWPELRGKQVDITEMLKKREAGEPSITNNSKRPKLAGKSKNIPKQTKLCFQNVPLKTNKKSIPSVHLTVPPVVKPTIALKDGQVSAKSLLTGPPKAPLCPKHKKLSSLKTVKIGPNAGRKFYVCSLPIGLSNSSTSSCDFFKWADNKK